MIKGKHMCKLLLIGLVLPSLSAASEPGVSAVDLANKMIKANSTNLSSIQGRFLCEKKDRLADGGKATIQLYTDMLNNSTRTSYRDQIERTIKLLKEDYKDGYADQSLEFSGTYVSPTKFSLNRRELSMPHNPLLLFKANGEKAMQYFEQGKHAIIDLCDVKNGLVRDRKNELGLIRNWAGPINHIRTNEKVEIVENTTYMGNNAIILKQGPTEWSLGEFSITHTVLPDKGYIAARTEYRDVETNTLVRAIDCSNIVELQPGIWRPLEVVDTKYAFSSYNFEEYQELDVDTVKKLTFVETPKINTDIPQETFDIVVPPGTTKVVDKTLDKPLVIEHDPDYVDTGAAYIESVLKSEEGYSNSPNNNPPNDTTNPENNNTTIEGDAHPPKSEQTDATALGVKVLIALVGFIALIAVSLIVYKARHGSNSV